MRLLMSPGSRSTALDSEASKFGGGCRVPSECTIGRLAECRLTRFQGIQRENRLQSRMTTDTTNKMTTASIRQKPYHNSSMFSLLMFLLHQPIGSTSLIGAEVILNRFQRMRTETRPQAPQKDPRQCT